MKFELDVQSTDRPHPTLVEFSLRKNLDGSIGLIVDNKLVNSPSEIITITTDGTIRLRSYSTAAQPTSFFQYEEKKNKHNRVWHYVKTVLEA